MRKHRPALLAGVLLLILLLLQKPITWKTAGKGHSTSRETGQFESDVETQSGKDCSPNSQIRIRNIVFLKTHKTGSSTFQNILFRLGEKRGLTFAFPVYTYQFAYPEKFAKGFVEDLPREATEFNILCSHMRLDVLAVQEVMPGSTFYLTILRDPVSTFESVFTYYRTTVPAFELVLNISGNPLTTFLAAPHHYYDSRYITNGLAKNPMTFDLGLNSTRERVDETWQKDLEKLEKDFHLVMIAEYFDESLILVKELLNLDFEDLVYVRLNTRPQGSRVTIDRDKSQQIRTWNQLDVDLYEHFNRTFWKKIQCYGHTRMKKELDVLESLTRQTRKSCLDGGPVGPEKTSDNLRPWQPDTTKILGYNLRRNLSSLEYEKCLRLVLPELRFHTYLYQRQYGRDMKTLPLD
ncbi:hypothetical protein NDU88_004404 [Pleurodeles waltl]|uniref:Galactose-3-O-sulfotransferase 2 n=1 Tax=Pleurodeles waltl TaxID=8319 RepID=A0AAV7T899_PLEWA|nr:hypothetical protein NDU88_004404 [Pleurodeles waltl]